MLRPTAISVTIQKDYTLKVIFVNCKNKLHIFPNQAE